MQMIARHLQDAPVPPSQRAEIPVPPALERVVLACLAKQPADRPASAAALARCWRWSRPSHGENPRRLRGGPCTSPPEWCRPACTTGAPPRPPSC